MSYQDAAKALSDRKVSACFGIPGGGASLGLITALEEKGIPFYLTHFEGSAAMMAATTGKLSSYPGISMSIKGPGLANALPGLAVAWFEAFPLVHIAEATPADAPQWIAHKRLNQINLCSAVTKAAGNLTAAGEGMHEALSAAASEEPGPVLLELAEGSPARIPTVQSPQYSDSKTEKSSIWEHIKQCRKPVVVAGSYATRQRVGEALASLQCPVFSTVSAKGIIDEASEYSAGVFTGVDEELTPEWTVLADADFVVSIGLTARELLAVKPFACPSLHFASYRTPGIDGFKFTWILPMEDLPEVLSAIKEKIWGSREISKTKIRLLEKLTHHFLPGRVYLAIERRFGQNVRMVLDTGAFCTVGEYLCRSLCTEYFIASGQGRYMGTSLPMALGASIYDRNVPTIAVMGDGGVGMYLSELKLAVQHRLPLLVVLMSDGGFGCIRLRAKQHNLNLDAIATDGKSWVDAIGGLGVPGTRVGKEEEFNGALKCWDPASGPAFIEVVFNPDRYEKMTEGVRA